jgi:DNA-binding transcriptional LysR family regulator
MTDVDWSLARSFLAIADAGSLSAAARVSGSSQPTLSRHLAELEAALGQRLFHRLPKGLRLTDAGAALVPHARAMAKAASRLRLAALGREEQLHGSVRVTASRAVAAHLLPPTLAALRREEPGFQLDLVASDHLEDLLRGDADLALRMVRPEQPDVIARHIAELPIGLYAARSYLARHPAPTTLDDLQQHTFIGFDRSELMLRMMATLGVHARREDFPVRCDDQLVHWQLVRAGSAGC